jgi:hypothetical protein
MNQVFTLDVIGQGEEIAEAEDAMNSSGVHLNLISALVFHQDSLPEIGPAFPALWTE